MTMRRSRFLADAVDQISDDGDVDEEYEDLDRCRMAVDFVCLEWHERTGDDDGEPLRPMPQKPKADALGEKQARIDKADDAEFPDLVGREVGCLLNGSSGDAAARVEVNDGNPMLQDGAYIGMNELEDADSGGDESSGFEQLEEGYES